MKRVREEKESVEERETEKEREKPGWGEKNVNASLATLISALTPATSSAQNCSLSSLILSMPSRIPKAYPRQHHLPFSDSEGVSGSPAHSRNRSRSSLFPYLARSVPRFIVEEFLLSLPRDSTSSQVNGDRTRTRTKAGETHQRNIFHLIIVSKWEPVPGS